MMLIALERATAGKLDAIETLRALGDGPAGPDLRALAEEADRLNETCRIYVNLMAANVRRRLQILSGNSGQAYGRGFTRRTPSCERGSPIFVTPDLFRGPRSRKRCVQA